MPKPASTPPNADSKRSLTVIETNENFIAIKKAMTLTIILKNAAENEDDKWKYFLVNRFVKAIQKAPINTKKIPNKDTWLFPKSSAEMITPEKPKKIARILIILIFSFKIKCDIKSNIKGDVNNTG